MVRHRPCVFCVEHGYLAPRHSIARCPRRRRPWPTTPRRLRLMLASLGAGFAAVAAVMDAEVRRAA